MGRGRLTALAAALAVLTACGGDGGLDALPRSFCSEPATAAGADPELLVVADMPTRGRSATSARAMAEAVRLTLARHGFKAGRHALAFQSCDDSTARTGDVDVERCAANGKLYGENAAVVGVVGPMHSSCAYTLLPGASSGGLAVVSPSATRGWLTRAVDGHPDQSGQLYPTGKRTFFRVAPPDDEQARVAAELASRLGVRRIFIASEPTDYGETVRVAVRSAARSVGMRTLGPAHWNVRGRRAGALAREVEASGADAVHLSGSWDVGGIQLVAALRAELGPRFPILGSDGFVSLPPRDARTAEGMWVTVPGIPAARLPPAGRAVVAALGAGQPGRLGPPFAAQATELLLLAIAASDGTRADVVRRLRGARLTSGPAGPMRFDTAGDPVPRHVALYRVRDSAVVPVD